MTEDLSRSSKVMGGSVKDPMRRVAPRLERRKEAASPEKRYLTRRDIELEYGIPRSTLAHWATAGKGPVFSVPGCEALYLRPDVDAFLASQRIDLPQRAAAVLTRRPPGRPRKVRRRMQNTREGRLMNPRVSPPIIP